MEINGLGVSSYQNFGIIPRNQKKDERSSIVSEPGKIHQSAEEILKRHDEWLATLGKLGIVSKQVSKEDYQKCLKDNVDFWEISPDAVDYTTAEILSRQVKDIKDVKDASTLAKIMIDEANKTELSYERHALLRRAIKLLPNGAYNNDKYSENLRAEILKSSLDLTKDPVNHDTVAIWIELGESEEKNNLDYKEWLQSGLVNYYTYSKMKAISSEDELKMMKDPTVNESKKQQFVYNKLFEAAWKEENKQEQVYLMKMAMANMQLTKTYLTNSEKLTRILAAEKIPELKEDTDKKIVEMFNSYFPELKGKDISQNTKIILLKKATSFKQGSGWVEPKDYVAFDKMSDILEISEQNKSHSLSKNISEKDKQELKNIAYEIAKKNGQGYVDALTLHYEDGKTFDIYRRKDDKILYLGIHNQNEFYNSEDNQIALEYIECGDASLTGGAFGINSALRKADEKVLNNPIMKKEIEGLDKLTTDKNTALDDEYVVLRAMGSGEYLEEYTKEGNIVLDKGYVSTTPHRGTYSNMFGGRPGETYVMRIKLPTGTRGANFKKCQPYLYGENEEFLLPRNSKFKIAKVNKDTKVIEAEYILPEYKD